MNQDIFLKFSAFVHHIFVQIWKKKILSFAHTLYENSFIFTYILADFRPSVVYLEGARGFLMVSKLKLDELILKQEAYNFRIIHIREQC